MREVKFRVWKHERIFANNYWSESSKDGSWVDHFMLSDTGNIFEGCVYDLSRLGGCDICQYTGLKDKNGKEIYEGDLLSHDNFDLDETPYQVTFGDGRYWLKDIGSDIFTGSSQELTSELIIIGNIFENPDMLQNHEMLD